MTSHDTTHLEVRGLTKSFYGVRAIDSVDFDLRGGEIHGLLGENGAGKSTLCSVLSGLYRPDSGSVLLDGEEVQFRSPQESANAGIGMVYQHFRLVDSFTVAQNIVLGLRRDQRPSSMRQVNQLVAELGEEYGLPVDPTASIWQLSVGEQQRVEILKQLFRGAKVLILDEPTAVLAPRETDRLFEAVTTMVERDHAVVLVSHKMAETMAYTNRISVLSRGRNAGSVTTADTTPEEVARMMFGDSAAAVRTSFGASTAVGAPVLSISDLRVMGDKGQLAVDHATLDVHRGEVVGIAGVAGNGQRELQEAIAGLRPVVDLMFMDFSLVAMDQIANQAAKLKYMFGGKATLPMTITTASGAGLSAAAQHSQSLEAMLAHVPGLKVVMPATPHDVKGLLVAAIRDDNPVVFAQNKRLFGLSGPVPEQLYDIPLGKANIVRPGTDVTIVAYSQMVHECLSAAKQLAEEGIECEVIDLRTIQPLDVDTIVESARKTNRIVVAHEAVRFGGLGAEIAAHVQEHAFDYLDAPVGRVGAPFTPVPFSPALEGAYVPNAKGIAADIRETLGRPLPGA